MTDMIEFRPGYVTRGYCVEVPIALHPTPKAIRNKRKRWRWIRALKREGVPTYLANRISYDKITDD